MTNRTLILVLVAAAVLSAVVAPAVAGQSDIATRDADLMIEQESYVNTDISRSTANGSVVYEVAGEQVDIHPQNFDAGDVVDFGVSTSTGSLDYQPDIQQWTFSSDGATGTFDVYWIVSESVMVNETVEKNNSTETRTTTEVRQVRYEAKIRVTDQAAVAVVSQDRYEQMKSDAGNWSAFIAEARQLRDEAMFIPDSATDQQVIKDMFSATRSVRDPMSFFTGSFTDWLFISFISIGGLFGMLVIKAPDIYLWVKERERRNRRESIEAEEGDITEKERQLADAQRLDVAQNTDIQDIYDDPHRAEAMLAHGPTFYDAVQSLKGWLGPKLVRAKLAEAGQNDVVAVVHRDGDTITSAELRDDEEGLEAGLDEDAELVDLTGAEDDSRYATDVNAWDVMDYLPADEAERLNDYDFSSEPWAPDELDLEDAELDLDAWLEQSDIDERYFESIEDYGETLRKLIRAYRQHPLTDQDGVEQQDRVALNEMLQALQLHRDVFEMPIAEWLLEGVEEAIRQDDPVADAQTTVDAAERGGLAGD